MHKINDYEKLKLNSLKFKLILTQMGFFNDLKGKKFIFNPKPFSNQNNKKEKTTSTENNVNLHLELTKKIDEVIEKNKFEEQFQNNKKITLPKFIEIRQPFVRRPEIPAFQTAINPKAEIGEIDDIQEFIEIDSPKNFLTEKPMENKNDSENLMINDQNEKDNKTFWGLGALKIRIKTKEPEKITTNNQTILTKIELEETKKEIERKKKELEEAIKKEKLKELELKKQEKERRKLEKLKKIELKKRLKEEKIKEKLAKKEQIEKELQLKKEIELQKLKLLKESKPEEKVIEEKILLGSTDLIEEKKDYSQDKLTYDEDVAKLLPILDNLFEKLPEEAIDEFTNSEYFELYEKVLLKYKK